MLLPLWIEPCTAQVFADSFEAGVGDWFADNGVWEVGAPTAGPGACFSGAGCVGTVLNGNYPRNANSRFISPAVALPSLAAGERIMLRIRHWFSMSNDNGRVQISADGGDWQTLSDPLFDHGSGAWSQYLADLSAFAGSTVRIAFLMTSGGDSNVASGWYVDEVSIEVNSITLRNPDNFEAGIGDWFADNGVWEVGMPTSGPNTCFSGSNCVGTVLGGNYPRNANSRLISPEIALIPASGERPRLRFQHWFSFSNDNGRVQISVEGGEWQDLSAVFDGSSGAWTQFLNSDPLSAFAGSNVRIAFLITSGGDSNVASGWYIDDVSIEGIESTPTAREEEEVPLAFMLHGAYPNPFNPTTTIPFSLSTSGHVILQIFNGLGQQVAMLVDGFKLAGHHKSLFDARGLPSGMYTYRLQASGDTATGKMILLK